MAIYWVEAVSTHRIVYAVESKEPPTEAEIHDRVNSGTISDVAQEWQGETVKSITEVDPETYIQKFDEIYADSVYKEWPVETKFQQIDNLNEEVILDPDE